MEVLSVTPPQSPTKLTAPDIPKRKKKKKINVLVLLMAKIVQINHP